MARYCFYCGRALSPGEKCTCREDFRKKTDSANSGQPRYSAPKKARTRAANDNKSDGTAHFNSETNSKKSSWFDNFKRQQSQRKAAKQQRSATRPKTRPVFSKPDKRAVFASLQQLIRFFTKPADTARQAVQFLDRRKAFLLISLEGFMGGLLMTVLSRQEQISGLFQLTIIQTGADSGFLSALFLFIQGVSLVLSLHMLLAALLYFMVKVMVRQPVDFTRLLSAISPISFYSAFFLLMSAMAMSGSLFYSVLLLAACFGMTMMMMFIILRHLCQLEENKAAGLTALLMTAYAAIISLMISQITPVLSTLFDMQLSL